VTAVSPPTLLHFPARSVGPYASVAPYASVGPYASVAPGLLWYRDVAARRAQGCFVDVSSETRRTGHGLRVSSVFTQNRDPCPMARWLALGLRRAYSAEASAGPLQGRRREASAGHCAQGKKEAQGRNPGPKYYEKVVTPRLPLISSFHSYDLLVGREYEILCVVGISGEEVTSLYHDARALDLIVEVCFSPVGCEVGETVYQGPE
jgi:hypothetical protein